MAVKTGGQVYLSQADNTVVVSDKPSLQNATKRLLIVACRVWHNITEEARYSTPCIAVY